jgi:hypothetical protein
MEILVKQIRPYGATQSPALRREAHAEHLRRPRALSLEPPRVELDDK